MMLDSAFDRCPDSRGDKAPASSPSQENSVHQDQDAFTSSASNKHWNRGARRIREFRREFNSLRQLLSDRGLKLQLTFLGVQHFQRVEKFGVLPFNIHAMGLELPVSVVKRAFQGDPVLHSIERSKFWHDVLRHCTEYAPILGCFGTNVLRPIRAARARCGALFTKQYFGETSYLVSRAIDTNEDYELRQAGHRGKIFHLTAHEFEELLTRVGQLDDFTRFGIAFVPGKHSILPPWMQKQEDSQIGIFKVPSDSFMTLIDHWLSTSIPRLNKRLREVGQVTPEHIFDAFLHPCLCLYSDLDQLSETFRQVRKRLTRYNGELSDVSNTGQLNVLHMGGAGHTLMLARLCSLLDSSDCVRIETLLESRYAHSDFTVYREYLFSHLEKVLSAIAIIDEEVHLDVTTFQALFDELLDPIADTIEREILLHKLSSLHLLYEVIPDADGGVSIPDMGSPKPSSLEFESPGKDFGRFAISLSMYLIDFEQSLARHLSTKSLRQALEVKANAAQHRIHLYLWTAVVQGSDAEEVERVLSSVSNTFKLPELRDFLATRELWLDGNPHPWDFAPIRDPEVQRRFLEARSRLV